MLGSGRSLPLHVLPAFEAAARLGSFRLAAAELHLTPSAVSHQIRLLEEAVGTSLFERLPRGLQLTDEGRAFASTVREVLERLETEAKRLSPEQPSGRLRLSLPDFVAHLFVLPALAAFRARHSHIDLDIQATMSLADVEAGDVDAAVRIGSGQWGKLVSHQITEVVGTVVASPELAAHALDSSRQAEVPMLCLDRLEQHTRQTLHDAGFRTHATRAVRVDSSMALLRAAEEGLGVTVVYTPPNKPFQPNARLVALSHEPIIVPFAMYFVCRQNDTQRPELVALRAWLIECIAS
ncbi:MAG TPA: LysR substrate-binding domain-containing protein [Polyangiaceae bacterium]|nr:LysR substrate-binding domain-containing protein [Polyangiaceae bacterium]